MIVDIVFLLRVAAFFAYGGAGKAAEVDFIAGAHEDGFVRIRAVGANDVVAVHDRPPCNVCSFVLSVADCYAISFFLFVIVTLFFFSRFFN